MMIDVDGIFAQVVYDRPFWRENGFSGEVVCDCEEVCLFVCFHFSLKFLSVESSYV